MQNDLRSGLVNEHVLKRLTHNNGSKKTRKKPEKTSERYKQRLKLQSLSDKLTNNAKQQKSNFTLGYLGRLLR